ncbi:hypothetical protein [Pseudomonas fluorescens]|uniref:hypothetical protein n=1 Tax=Pseudomonas fluorescens TaxID=294 RepID=UPI0015598785|nr:hypothetical protein [Pseudomonas fluorescens]
MFPRTAKQSPEIAFCLANMTPPDACNSIGRGLGFNDDSRIMALGLKRLSVN